MSNDRRWIERTFAETNINKYNKTPQDLIAFLEKAVQAEASGAWRTMQLEVETYQSEYDAVCLLRIQGFRQESDKEVETRLYLQRQAEEYDRREYERLKAKFES